MTRTSIQMVGAIVVLCLCAVGFYSQRILGAPLSGQMASLARIVAIVGFVVLLGIILWNKYSASAAGGD